MLRSFDKTNPIQVGAVGRRPSACNPVDIVPVESALRPNERSARRNGAVVRLTGLPASGKSTLARALERRLFGRGGSPIMPAPGSCTSWLSARTEEFFAPRG
jgi:hypothetical protein